VVRAGEATIELCTRSCGLHSHLHLTKRNAALATTLCGSQRQRSKQPTKRNARPMIPNLAKTHSGFIISSIIISYLFWRIPIDLQFATGILGGGDNPKPSPEPNSENTWK